MKNVQSKKGFTLIELLIVIAIIAVLAVAFLPTLLGAPSKSRDTQRTTSITNLSNFLMTQTLTNKTLPATGCIDTATGTDIGKLIGLNLPEFGGVFPLDPKADNSTTGAGLVACKAQYGYIKYNTTVKGYSAVVYAAVENVENANILCSGLKDGTVPVLTPGKIVVADASLSAGCYAGLVQ